MKNAAAKQFAKKLLLTGLCILLYYMIWRPGRELVHEKVIYPLTDGIVQSASQDQELYIIKSRSVAFQLYNGTIEKSEAIVVKIPGGLFLLLGGIGLLLSGADSKYYILLFFLHIIGGLAAYGFLFLGILGIDFLLYMPEFLIEYLIPAFSLALVPVSMSEYFNGSEGKLLS